MKHVFRVFASRASFQIHCNARNVHTDVQSACWMGRVISARQDIRLMLVLNYAFIVAAKRLDSTSVMGLLAFRAHPAASLASIPAITAQLAP